MTLLVNPSDFRRTALRKFESPIWATSRSKTEDRKGVQYRPPPWYHAVDVIFSGVLSTLNTSWTNAGATRYAVKLAPFSAVISPGTRLGAASGRRSAYELPGRYRISTSKDPWYLHAP